MAWFHLGAWVSVATGSSRSRVVSVVTHENRRAAALTCAVACSAWVFEDAHAATAAVTPICSSLGGECFGHAGVGLDLGLECFGGLLAGRVGGDEFVYGRHKGCAPFHEKCAGLVTGRTLSHYTLRLGSRRNGADHHLPAGRRVAG